MAAGRGAAGATAAAVDGAEAVDAAAPPPGAPRAASSIALMRGSSAGTSSMTSTCKPACGLTWGCIKAQCGCSAILSHI